MILEQSQGAQRTNNMNIIMRTMTKKGRRTKKTMKTTMMKKTLKTTIINVE